MLEAEQEMNSTARYYNQKTPGLGYDFLDEIDWSFNFIRASPERWACVNRQIRKYNMRRFPFAIYYLYEQELKQVIIVSVAHHKRYPNYWKHRI